MTTTVQQIEEIVSVLTSEEKQLLKDTILKGAWRSVNQEFLNEQGEIEVVDGYGYCPNKASQAGHFQGHTTYSMFSSIYRKLCPVDRYRIGKVISHCINWWIYDSGDMLFIRESHREAFEQWAKL